MLRGEIWWVNFDPSLGGEIKKARPAVIISNDTANKSLNRIQVVPLTTSVDRVYPSEAIVVVNGEQAKALADPLATVSKLRLGNKLGQLSASDLQKVEQIVKVQLGLLT